MDLSKMVSRHMWPEIRHNIAELFLNTQGFFCYQNNEYHRFLNQLKNQVGKTTLKFRTPRNGWVVVVKFSDLSFQKTFHGYPREEITPATAKSKGISYSAAVCGAVSLKIIRQGNATRFYFDPKFDIFKLPKMVELDGNLATEERPTGNHFIIKGVDKIMILHQGFALDKFVIMPSSGSDGVKVKAELIPTYNTSIKFTVKLSDSKDVQTPYFVTVDLPEMEDDIPVATIVLALGIVANDLHKFLRTIIYPRLLPGHLFDILSHHPLISSQDEALIYIGAKCKTQHSQVSASDCKRLGEKVMHGMLQNVGFGPEFNVVKAYNIGWVTFQLLLRAEYAQNVDDKTDDVRYDFGFDDVRYDFGFNDLLLTFKRILSASFFECMADSEEKFANIFQHYENDLHSTSYLFTGESSVQSAFSTMDELFECVSAAVSTKFENIFDQMSHECNPSIDHATSNAWNMNFDQLTKQHCCALLQDIAPQLSSSLVFLSKSQSVKPLVSLVTRCQYVTPIQAFKSTSINLPKVFVNGTWIGVSGNIRELLLFLYSSKTDSRLPASTTIHYSKKGVDVMVSGGRPCVLVINCVNDQALNLTLEEADLIKKKEIRLTDLMLRGCVEFVSTVNQLPHIDWDNLRSGCQYLLD